MSIAGYVNNKAERCVRGGIAEDVVSVCGGGIGGRGHRRTTARREERCGLLASQETQVEGIPSRTLTNQSLQCFVRVLVNGCQKLKSQ